MLYVVVLAMRIMVVFYVVVVLTNLVTPCPNNCTCVKSHKSVQCVALDLTTFPTQLSNSTASLSMLNNQLTTLTVHSVMGLKHMEILHLSNNPLQRIDGEVLCKMPLLKWLVLDNTNISFLAPHTFACLNRLEQLSLQNNHLTSLHVDTFAGLKNFNI